MLLQYFFCKSMDFENSTLSILPKKSSARYELHYQRFKSFMLNEGIDDYTEAYKKFYIHIRNTMSASSCSTIMCAIRRCLINDNVNITLLALELVKNDIKKRKKAAAAKKSSLLPLEHAIFEKHSEIGKLEEYFSNCTFNNVQINFVR